MGVGASVKKESKDLKLRQALQNAEDLSEFSIPEIARSKLEYPEVKPSQTKKSDLYTPGKFRNVDDTVKMRSMNVIKFPTFHLVRALLDGLIDPLEKLRALYYFTTNIDLSCLKFSKNEILMNSPLEYLMRIRELKGNHAHLFCALCKVAGIPCEIITGVNKSSAYQLGKPINRKAMAAQWNAVYVNGEWRLIDCFWSSTSTTESSDSDNWAVLDIDGHIIAGNKLLESSQPSYSINEFFFLTDPTELLATHLPNVSKWQLVDNDMIISGAMFEQSAYRRERYYELDMQTLRVDLDKCTLLAEDGELTVDMYISNDSPNIKFKYMLFMAKNSEEMKKLDKYVMYQRRTGSVSFMITIPVTGVFKLEIFGKDSRKHKTFDLVCSYLIDCGIASIQSEPLPDNPAIGWGPGDGSLEAFGMKATNHQQAYIYTNTGLVDIKFKTDRDLELSSFLLSNNKSKHDLRQQCVLKVFPGECCICAHLHTPGIYACKLFANEEGIVNELQNVCNYLIKYTDNVQSPQILPLPYVPNGKLGVFSVAKELGIELLYPVDPEMKTKNGKVSIKLRVTKDVQLHTAIYHPTLSGELTNKSVQISKQGDIVTLRLDLTTAGQHTCAVYASADGSQAYNIANIMINNESKNSQHKDKPLLELPTPEKIYAPDGIVKLHIPNSNSEELIAILTKESIHNDIGSTQSNYPAKQIVIKRNRAHTEITTTVPQDGPYELQVLETDNQREMVKIKKRFQILPGEDPSTIKGKREKELQERLAHAIETGSKNRIEEAMMVFKKSGMPETDTLYKRAQLELSIIDIDQALKDAVRSKVTSQLVIALNRAKHINHGGTLNTSISEAQRLYEKPERLAKLRHSVLNLDQRTIAEIKSFAKPPALIITVMRCTLLLLGNDEEETKDWNKINLLIGKTGAESLKRRVKEFRVEDVPSELTQKVKAILEQMKFDDVMIQSAGAGTFYLWSRGMVGD